MPLSLEPSLAQHPRTLPPDPSCPCLHPDLPAPGGPSGPGSGGWLPSGWTVNRVLYGLLGVGLLWAAWNWFQEQQRTYRLTHPGGYCSGHLGGQQGVPQQHGVGLQRLTTASKLTKRDELCKQS